ncbi:MAG: HD domain-containing protein [Clostridiales bacterium]|nr:HD domain-containing protein [Clostridiales bacterium]
MNTLNIHIPNKILFVLDRLNEAGYEAFIVGGCVRDSILGKTPHDWDIATSATPEEIQEVFSGYRQTDAGLKHGTVGIVIDKELIEITTYRIESKYSDGRRPDKVHFASNILDDLARRDFSVNACAMTKTEIIDPFDGRKDIKNRLIRCVGNPIDRFTEDALRILRGIRFASVLGFKVEQKTKQGMFACKHLLKNISQERITDEFCGTLLGMKVYDTLMEFRDIAIFIIPELKDMIGFEQHNKHHKYDVYQHTLKSVELIDSDIILRAAMFFHDIGKPKTFSLDINKVGHFYGHAQLSSQITRKILKRMRFSNKDIHDISQLIKYHDRKILLTSKSIKRLLNDLGEIQFRRLIKVKRADAMSKSPSFLKDKLDHLDAVEEILDQIIAKGACVSLGDLAVNGHDLIELGIPEGKKIGTVLNRLLELVLNDEIENNRKALIEKAESFLE